MTEVTAADQDASIGAAKESFVRQVAKQIMTQPGFGHHIDAIIVEFRIRLAFDNRVPSTDPIVVWCAKRLETILREIATGDAHIIVGKYFDLLPDELRKIMLDGALEVLKSAGADVAVCKDENGTTFVQVEGIEKLGIPEDVMEQVAETMPAPIGSLHRVQ